MSGVTVRVRGGKELRAAMRSAGAQAQKALGSALHMEAEAVMSASKQLAPVGTDGVLRSSGFVKAPVTTGTRTTVELGYGGAAAGYAVYAHEGTGPAVGRAAFFPPPSALVRWVSKFVGPEGAGTEAKPGPVTWLIARAIGRRGLKPNKFLERPLRERARGMAARLARRVSASVRP